jgi:uncharacterized protein (TIGR03084 family)
MQEVVQALRAEYRGLERLLAGLLSSDWTRRTDFFDWTVSDEIMHLHLVDLFALQSISDAAGFADTVRGVRAAQARGIELSAQMRARFSHWAPDELTATWRRVAFELCDRLERDDAKRRVAWFGPEMSVKSLAAARQMEVWAHGQDIFDLLDIRRHNTDNLRNICDLGVRTFGWSFRNRGEPVPEQAPRVALCGPSGAHWLWNADHVQSIEGEAEEFALVVTQRRNIADTRLRVDGADAARWMAIAQCFAGGPDTPPPPGARASKMP